MKQGSLKWLRLGTIFSFEDLEWLNKTNVKAEASFYRAALFEEDQSLPIIGNDISRVEIFDSLIVVMGAKLLEQFARRDTELDNSIAEYESAAGNQPRIQHIKVSPENRMSLRLGNVFMTIAAIARIGAMMLSEKNPPHRVSRSKSNAKDGYEKDKTLAKIRLPDVLEAAKELEAIGAEFSALDVSRVRAIVVSEYIRDFAPELEGEIRKMQRASSFGDFIQSCQSAIEKLDSLRERNKTVRSEATIAFDRDLRLFFSKKEICKMILSMEKDLADNGLKVFRPYRTSIRFMISEYWNRESFYPDAITVWATRKRSGPT